MKPATYERMKARAKARYRDDPQFRKRRLDHERERRQHPNYRHAYAARVYGTTVDHVKALRSTVACEACGRPFDLSRPKGLMAQAIDHDHATGTIRGVLCGRCNVALGLVEDSTELLDALRVYLLRRQ